MSKPEAFMKALGAIVNPRNAAQRENRFYIYLMTFATLVGAALVADSALAVWVANHHVVGWLTAIHVFLNTGANRRELLTRLGAAGQAIRNADSNPLSGFVPVLAEFAEPTSQETTVQEQEHALMNGQA
jgi:hypothetical protein